VIGIELLSDGDTLDAALGGSSAVMLVAGLGIFLAFIGFVVRWTQRIGRAL